MSETDSDDTELSDYEISNILEKTDSALEQTDPGKSPEAHQALSYIQIVVGRAVDTGETND